MRDHSPGFIIFLILGIAALVGLYAMKGVELHDKKQQRALQEMKSDQWQREWQEKERAKIEAEERLAAYTAMLEEEEELAETNLSDPRMHKGHEYVDLGLSVKWALCNVGATLPQKRGVCFAWGDPELRSVFDWTTYKWSLGPRPRTRYNCSNVLGYVDSLAVLLPEDDVASVRWGGRWRMPTEEEMKELVDQCEWQWTTQGDTQGYLVTSKVNGNSLFFPVSDHRSGVYWSSSLRKEESRYAFCLKFNAEKVRIGSEERPLGYPVRPVFP